MHRFVLRIRDEVFNHAKIDAKARGISINDYLNYCIEVAIAEFIKESTENYVSLIKNKAIQKGRKRISHE